MLRLVQSDKKNSTCDYFVSLNVFLRHSIPAFGRFVFFKGQRFLAAGENVQNPKPLSARVVVWLAGYLLHAAWVRLPAVNIALVSVNNYVCHSAKCCVDKLIIVSSNHIGRWNQVSMPRHCIRCAGQWSAPWEKLVDTGVKNRLVAALFLFNASMATAVQFIFIVGVWGCLGRTAQLSRWADSHLSASSLQAGKQLWVVPCAVPRTPRLGERSRNVAKPMRHNVSWRRARRRQRSQVCA